MRRFLRHHTRHAAGLGPLVIASLLLTPGRAIGDAITVTDWLLGTVVDAAGYDAQSSSTVQNPFQATHFASVGNSTAETVYDFAWAAQFASFLIQGAHQAEDMHASSRSNGLIYFDTTEDLFFNIDISYDYNLPGGALRAGFTMLLLDVDTHEHFAGDSQHDDSWSNGPVSGTLTGLYAGILPADRSYAIQYGMAIVSYGTSGYLGTGSGHIDFTLTPIPEPATAWLLALGALCLRRRTRRRRSRHRS